jgi:hypothetical protein
MGQYDIITMIHHYCSSRALDPNVGYYIYCVDEHNPVSNFLLNIKPQGLDPFAAGSDVVPDDDFVYGVLDSGAHIKMPSAGYKLETPIELAVDQPVAGSGTNATKSTIDLPAGTKLSLTGSQNFVTLVQAMKVTSDFTVSADFLETPRIYLVNGIKILKGHQLPGDMTIKANTPLPASITINQRVILAADCVLAEDSYIVPQYSVLAPGSVINRGSVFTEGMEISSPVTLGPILSLSADNLFYFLEESKFSTDIHLPYLAINGAISTLIVDDRDALDRLRDAISRIQSLEALLASRS